MYSTRYLDNEIHVALVIVAGGRGVGAHDQGAVDPGREVDVLAHGETYQKNKET